MFVQAEITDWLQLPVMGAALGASAALHGMIQIVVFTSPPREL